MVILYHIKASSIEQNECRLYLFANCAATGNFVPKRQYSIVDKWANKNGNGVCVCANRC